MTSPSAENSVCSGSSISSTPAISSPIHGNESQPLKSTKLGQSSSSSSSALTIPVNIAAGMNVLKRIIRDDDNADGVVGDERRTPSGNKKLNQQLLEKSCETPKASNLPPMTMMSGLGCANPSRLNTIVGKLRRNSLSFAGTPTVQYVAIPPSLVSGRATPRNHHQTNTSNLDGSIMTGAELFRRRLAVLSKRDSDSPSTLPPPPPLISTSGLLANRRKQMQNETLVKK
jgi:hypothetical protein